MKDIDKIVENVETAVRDSKSVDLVDEKGKKIDLFSIMMDADILAKTMKSPREENICKSEVIEKDNLLVDAKDILKWNREQFVEVAYQKILRRNANQFEIDTWMEYLNVFAVSKVQIINTLLESDEGKNAGVKVINMSMPQLLDKVKKIPVLGYLMRWIKSIILLPRMLNTYEIQFNQLYSKTNEANRKIVNHATSIKLHEEQVLDISNSLISQQSQIDHISLNLQDNISVLEGQDNTIRQITTNIQNNNKIISYLKNKAEGESLFNKKTYSQAGEDAIAGIILAYLNIPFEKVTYLDLGANHPIEMSNSYYFYTKGAHGVLVEANPELIDELRNNRDRDIIVNKAISFDGDAKEIPFYSMSGDGLSTICYESAKAACLANPEIFIKQVYNIETITISQIFEQYFYEKNPTIMSIDLEGIEEKILEQIDFTKYRPTIIIVEDIPYSPQLVVESKENKVKQFLFEKGYTEYAFTGINAIYLDLEYRNNHYKNS